MLFSPLRVLTLALAAAAPLVDGRAAGSPGSSLQALLPRRVPSKKWPDATWAAGPGDPQKQGNNIRGAVFTAFFPDLPTGYIRCGQSWQTANFDDMTALLTPWPLESDPEFSTKFTYLPPSSCTRVACFRTSGAYLCNTLNHTLMLETAFNLTWAIKSFKLMQAPSESTHRTDIPSGCCDNIERNVFKPGYSGEWRSTGPLGVPGWLAVLGYANCNDDRMSPYPGGGPGKWDGVGSPYNGRCHQLEPGNWPNTEGDTQGDSGCRYPAKEPPIGRVGDWEW
ncbi:hypothetical protein GGTG_06380 [Gaeumannomyces tritici R3-111a-1]|uniref:Uncharacterized protein n=1 Tax=Gaeumannomyces tritici (strain R3-111a-1) TaxID=644352 RepID=J3NYM8_GAET3|nr:hypothetical protein GGTG_06380 [Gaeumannomyces tritici R3-111a-1]EJT76461.1 hypothetical protein GGTG_06380 [Gaeumannomyces tritici R3-111a-1]